MMKQRRLGATGPATSAIGLGCMGMSEFYGQTDDADALRTLERALDIGVTHFDSADTYGLGHNETLLGRFIAQGGAARRVGLDPFKAAANAARHPAETEAA